MFELPPPDSLKTESDVEQKFIYPLLVSKEIVGLKHDPVNIQTKENIRRLKIGKGTEIKSYYPDYIITMSGLPFAVIEAKRPGEDLVEAYREARLYAAEINHISAPKLNPVEWIVATDGTKILAGKSDHNTPIHELTRDDINPTSLKFAEFESILSAEALQRWHDSLIPKMRPKRFWKPRKLVGGIALQREEVGLNSFGATISADFSHIFNPLSRGDRADIAKHAYISSKRRERYVEPIDRIIRAAAPPSETRSKALEDTSSPKEIISAFRKGRSLERQVMLIIGNAGAGKTTFVDYLQEVALPADVRSSTLWLRLDMNPAPVSRDEIYKWLRQKMIKECQRAFPNIDFDEIDTIKSILSTEVTKFRKGVGRLYEADRAVYNQKLGELIQSLQADLGVFAQNLIRYCSSDRKKLLVVVFDNSDKKLLSEQLLMFEVAQWIQKEFGALVVLPLREETYDNHQNAPPLDTALKDLVFRIEPPLFQKILQSRIQMALNAIKVEGTKTLRYELPNGMHVEYPASDQGHYLSSILRSVFEHDMHVRRLIVGLAGRNMRRAMEIFLEFCTSGHITEDHILKMVQSKGQYVLPLSLVTTVLLRSNLRFYDSDRSYLKNIFASSEMDDRPNYFTRWLILAWLSERANTFGPRRLKGYAHIGELRAEIMRFGVGEDVFRREIESLARGYCVTSEDFKVDNLVDEDLVSIAPAGRVHIQICEDPYYLAAIAEDTWFSIEYRADHVSDRIKNPQTHYLIRTVLMNANDALKQLTDAYRLENAAYDAVFDDDRFRKLVSFDNSVRNLRRFESSVTSGPWVGALDKLPVGSRHLGRVDGVKNFGAFVVIEGVTGLLHRSRMPSGAKVKVGDTLEVEVFEIDPVEKKLGLNCPNF